MKQPLVYIILVNWNGLEDTLDCLESLSKVDYSNYEIIVVDNGSDNNQAEMIKKKFPYTQLIKNKKNKGFTIACNQGIKLALRNGAEYILLLNNDTTVKNDFLIHIIKYAEQNTGIGILGSKILYPNFDKIWSMGGRIGHISGIGIMIGKGENTEKYNQIVEPDFVSGCTMLIRREVIERVGLLDPIYFAYYEDADYCFRVKKAGYKIKVIPESIVWHKKSSSSGEKGSFRRLSPLQHYLITKNQILFLKKFSRWKIAIGFAIITRLSYLALYNGMDVKSLKSLVKGAIDGVTFRVDKLEKG